MRGDWDEEWREKKGKPSETVQVGVIHNCSPVEFTSTHDGWTCSACNLPVEVVMVDYITTMRKERKE